MSVPAYIGKIIWQGKSEGTGFVIQDLKTIITCYHVLKEAVEKSNQPVEKLKDYEFQFQLLENHPHPIKVKITESDADSDIALLEPIEGHTLPNIRLPILSSSSILKPHDKVHIVGFGVEDVGNERANIVPATGKFELTYNLEDSKIHWLHLKLTHVLTGMSGSPVLHSDSETVVGIVSRREPNHKKRTLATRIEVLNDLFPRHFNIKAHVKSSRVPETVTQRFDKLIKSAKDIKTIDEFHHKPIGQDPFLEQIKSHILAKQNVALFGLSGIGKSLIAAEVVAQSLEAKDGLRKVAWVNVGLASNRTVLENIAKDDESRRALLKGKQSDKDIIKKYIKKNKVQMVVLDNCANSEIFKEIYNTLSPFVALLITTQLAEIKTIITQQVAKKGIPLPIPDLTPQNAVKVLAFYASKPENYYNNDAQAYELCKRYNYLPLLLRLAGLNISTLNSQSKNMADIEHTPGSYLKKQQEDRNLFRISHAGSNLSIAVEQQLRVYSDSQYEQANKALFIFGAFFTPTLSREMLWNYLIKTNQVHIFDNDVSLFSQTLDNLLNLGLLNSLRLMPQDQFRYQLHEAIYGYVREELESQTNEQAHDHALEVCRDYVSKYASQRDTSETYKHLQVEIKNVIGAIQWADSKSNDEYRRRIKDIALALSEQSRFTQLVGNFTESIEIIQKGVAAAKELNLHTEQGILLKHLAILFSELGILDKATEYAEAALQIFEKADDKKQIGRAKTTQATVLWRQARANEEKFSDNIPALYEAALQLAREIGDREGECRALGDHGQMLSESGQDDPALEKLEAAIRIANEESFLALQALYIGEGKAISLFYLGDKVNAKKEWEKARDIARQIGDIIGEYNFIGNSAEACLELKDLDEAQRRYLSAYIGHRDVEYTSGYGEWARGLGMVYEKRGNVLKVTDKDKQLENYYEAYKWLNLAIGEEGSPGLPSTHNNYKEAQKALKRIKGKIKKLAGIPPDESTPQLLLSLPPH